jgi:WD40 repeat protein
VVVWRRNLDEPGSFSFTPTPMRLHTHIAWQVAISPSGRQFATVSEDGLAVVCDTASGEEVACFAPRTGMRGVCFASETRLICGGGEGTLFAVDIV